MKTFYCRIQNFNKKTHKEYSRDYLLDVETRKEAFLNLHKEVGKCLEDPEWVTPELHVSQEGDDMCYIIEDEDVKMIFLTNLLKSNKYEK